MSLMPELLGELAAVCLAAFGLSVAALIQCAGDKRVPAKKKIGGAGSKSSKSKRSSKRSARSRRDKLKRGSSKSVSSRKSGKSNKSKVSARGPNSKRELKDAAQKVNRKVSDGAEKTARSTKEVAESAKEKIRSAKDKVVNKAKEVAPKITSEAEKLTTTRLKSKEQPSLKSLQETQKDVPSKRQASAFSANKFMELLMEPRELRFTGQGGLETVQLHNPTDQLCAFKVKCSDNDIYRVNPVFGTIRPKSSLNVYIVRQGAAKKSDKIVFVLAKIQSEDADVKQLFQSVNASETPMLMLPLVAA